MQLVLGGKRVGEVEHGTLVKKGSQVILFKIYNGFGVAAAALKHPAIRSVELHHNGKIYRASCESILNGIRHQTPGYEEQYVLPVKKWACEDPAQVRMEI